MTTSNKIYIQYDKAFQYWKNDSSESRGHFEIAQTFDEANTLSDIKGPGFVNPIDVGYVFIDDKKAPVQYDKVFQYWKNDNIESKGHFEIAQTFDEANTLSDIKGPAFVNSIDIGYVLIDDKKVPVQYDKAFQYWKNDNSKNKGHFEIAQTFDEANTLSDIQEPGFVNPINIGYVLVDALPTMHEVL